MTKRIAILGGGMSSLVTAFELTNVPGWKQRYDITVYQEGWRLGGKGASGRNADAGQRIEEHGLHILFGFYDNTFRVMREVYGEIGRNPREPLATWRDAFHPQDLVVMMEHVDGEWLPWPVEWPKNPEEPGTGGVALKPWDYVLELLEWASSAFHGSEVGATGPAITGKAVLATLASTTDELRERVAAAMGEPAAERSAGGVLEETLLSAWRALTRGARAAGRAVHEHPGEILHLGLAHAFARALPDDPERHHERDHRALIWLIDRFRDWLHRPEHAEDGTVSTELRRLRIIVDFTLAMARGLIADGVIFPPHDFFALDDMDLRAWLRKHGAREETVRSPVVTGPYDAAFAAFNEVGAGTGVHGILRMSLTYKGSVLWKMQAGMGDTIFAPLYTVLERRGVHFRFFHQVDRLRLSGDGKRVERVDMTVQATLKDPDTGYEPLVDVDGLPCWPDRPRYDQLVEGEALRERGVDLEDWWTSWEGVKKTELVAGEDFEELVLGISVGALPFIAEELVGDERNPRFGAMARAVATTQTRAAQLWFRPDLAGLGWKGDSPIVIPYAEPFDTWADMTHLLAREEWPEDFAGNLAYLCSPLPDDEPIPPRTDHEYPARQRARVYAMLREWLRDYTSGLWPTATETDNPNALNPWFLADYEDRDGWARLDGQYWRATVSPSERYVLSVPGSVHKRLRPGESGYANLTLTGDWTRNFMSVGCLECATAAGLLAARAVEPAARGALGDWESELAGDPPRSLDTARVARPGPRVELPSWITRDNDEVAFAPVKIDTTVYMFTVEADYDALQAMCDRELNVAGDVIYRPLAPLAVVYCSEVDNYPQVNPVGWVPEIDYGIWIPLLGGKREGPVWIPDRLVTYTPYIWVSNGVALIGGRTVFGFVKELGAMTLPKDPGHAARFSLESLVIEKYSPESKAETATVMDVARKDESVWQELETLWRDGEAFLDGIHEEMDELLSGHDGLPVPTFAGVRKILDEMRHGMRMVFLKQFPSIDQAGRACFQAVTEADLPIISEVQGGWLPGDWEVEVHCYDSCDIVKTLGLRPATTHDRVATLKPLFHGWSKFSAMVQPGEIIWKRP